MNEMDHIAILVDRVNKLEDENIRLRSALQATQETVLYNTHDLCNCVLIPEDKMVDISDNIRNTYYNSLKKRLDNK